jgi:aspartyl-tRNA(Asn)/glutamyl-tRNA(Gln) amidotransferase subunit A
MSDPTQLTLTQAVKSLKKGDISSKELTLSHLERISQFEPDLHAFITQTADLALEQAEQSDKRLVAWRREPTTTLPDLIGIPISIKDVLCVADIRCTCGSRILENYIPPFNATVVERLLEAGVVILGKTNTDEFAMGSSTENSAFGTTHNPWDFSRVPGGSSGGSAAAVAASMTPIALGTDTGGSVRQPASFCGVTGIKPTYGRVSRYGLIAYGSSLDVIGGFARSTQDLQILFNQISGHDPLDATSLPIPSPIIKLEAAPELVFPGIRVGLPDEYFIEGLQPKVETAVRAAVQILENSGAIVKQVSLPHTEFALPVYYLIAPAEASANLARYDGIRYGPRVQADRLWDVYKQTRGQKFGAEVKRRIMLGTYALSKGYYEAYYGQAQKVRTLIKRDFDEVFEHVDIIAAPVAPTTAFQIGEHTNDPLAMYLEDVFTLPANLAGIPGITFPVGYDHNELPIGMQIMGPHFHEEILFKIAHAYQQLTDWHTKKPNL